MDLRTEIKIDPSGNQINLKDPVLFIGSCFSENIGRKLEVNKFNVLINPFGTLYNPFSIFNNLGKAVSGDHVLNESDIVISQGTYRCMDFHSAISHVSRTGLEELAIRCMQDTRNFLSRSDWLVITFGTALVYPYKKTGSITANCHKLPSSEFTRRIMTVNEIVSGFEKMHESLLSYNKNLHILLTVSPVRHLKEGFENNQSSKSALRLACDSITSGFKNVSYFPSYEIMMDDLRDYRFYDRDLVHPNDLGIEYIWEKFRETFIDPETRLFMNDWNKILQALQHRPFHPETEEYKSFIRHTLEKLNALKNRINVENEVKKLTEKL